MYHKQVTSTCIGHKYWSQVLTTSVGHKYWSQVLVTSVGHKCWSQVSVTRDESSPAQNGFASGGICHVHHQHTHLMFVASFVHVVPARFGFTLLCTTLFTANNHGPNNNHCPHKPLSKKTESLSIKHVDHCQNNTIIQT